MSVSTARNGPRIHDVIVKVVRKAVAITRRRAWFILEAMRGLRVLLGTTARQHR
jgi:hypothetical protein